MDNRPITSADDLRHEITRQLPGNSGKRAYVFLDEIQEVRDWERAVNSLRVERNVDLFITGSNARLLSGELATLLSGRYVQIPVYPFSFREFVEMQNLLNGKTDAADACRSYLMFGGMPYLAQVSYSQEPSQQYLHDLFDAVQLKDIVQRAGIRDTNLLERLLVYVFANVGTPFSAR